MVDDHLPKVMDEPVRVLLFQAVRELLVNIISTPGPAGAVVAIRREADWIRVAVSDDGLGFDPAAVRASTGRQGGFGLFNIQERLASIGGSLGSRARGRKGPGSRCGRPLPAEERRRGK